MKKGPAEAGPFKRADTRGGLSKGLGAFRIGRPLASDNGRAPKSVPARLKNYSSPGRGHLGSHLRLHGGGGDFRGMTVGRTEHQGQQQGARDQHFDGMFKE